MFEDLIARYQALPVWAQIGIPAAAVGGVAFIALRGRGSGSAQTSVVAGPGVSAGGPTTGSGDSSSGGTPIIIQLSSPGGGGTSGASAPGPTIPNASNASGTSTGGVTQLTPSIAQEYGMFYDPSGVGTAAAINAGLALSAAGFPGFGQAQINQILQAQASNPNFNPNAQVYTGVSMSQLSSLPSGNVALIDGQLWATGASAPRLATGSTPASAPGPTSIPTIADLPAVSTYYNPTTKTFYTGFTAKAAQ